jgi:hypothetical protein
MNNGKLIEIAKSDLTLEELKIFNMQILDIKSGRKL